MFSRVYLLREFEVAESRVSRLAFGVRRSQKGMEFTQDDFDRLLLFEHTRKTAEANYAENPLDADVRIVLH